ncbi:hypothetical protein BST99_02825 [Aureicoccus marinus]|uniref:Uncharacterized protein n=1 Tax=Aureicoccus marinus TaxID=754435 RepID=A0A2S7T5K3_9FLAO|nr:hypothetical protein BST99_02825 [Aureicoccus marinus]
MVGNRFPAELSFPRLLLQGYVVLIDVHKDDEQPFSLLHPYQKKLSFWRETNVIYCRNALYNILFLIEKILKYIRGSVN